MNQMEKESPAKRTRRWALKRLGLGAAEIAIGLVSPYEGPEMPLITTGLVTVAATVYDTPRDPIVCGLAVGGIKLAQKWK